MPSQTAIVVTLHKINKLAKVFVKAINGAAHSYAFTFDQYDKPFRIKKWNGDIVQNT